MNYIYEYFPFKIEEILRDEIGDNIEMLQEIRIRVDKPIILEFDNAEKVVKYIITCEDIMNILQVICENSIYSYQNQIKEGFITLYGGHRVGLTGSCVIENGKIITINYINSLNFRIAKQIIGCADKVIKYILNIKDNTIKNTLIVSSPGAGKTTLLRDIVRQISNGSKTLEFKGLTVGVVDERNEISAMYKGVLQNDLGIKTDVLENVPKPIGLKMLIRSMSPKVIVADEIGSKEDVKMINYAITSGCKGIFTAHGDSFDDLYINPIMKEIVSMNIFEIIIFLDLYEKGKIKEIYQFDKKLMQYIIILKEE